MNTIPRVIINAGGMGKRLYPLTADKPKCLLEVAGKTIMERQLETLKECGITDISVIRGYQGDKIKFPGIKYYEDPNYRNSNILNGFFCAEPAMIGAFITSYADIIFDKSVIQKLLEDKSNIAIVVDIDWRDYYQNRTKHPLEEAEKVVIRDGKVLKIGKHLTVQEADGEFIGMAKFSEKGAEIFKKEFREVKSAYWGKPFQKASVFERAYLTDMFQELINKGIDIYPVLIKKNWWEMDTAEDLEKVRKIFQTR